MAPFPLQLSTYFGHWGSYIVYLLIGFAFGYTLEIAGFGKSTKLAAQFYFKEMTVLKVMFTAIIVAMVLVFLTSAIGLLDYNLVWVNPTYLWPGIVGGLIMGVGFIVGGFCPGTSLVAAATLKLDGIMFVLGVFFGIFLFGETVGLYEDFWYSSYMGRFTLMDLFNTSTGVVVVGVVVMALVAFWFAEQGERIFGGMDLSRAPKWRYGAAGGVLAIALAVLFIGQPTIEQRWAKMAPEMQPKLDEGAYYIHPGEVLDLIHDSRVNVILLDVRDVADFNVFHIQDSVNIPMEDLRGEMAKLREEPANTVFFVIGNDETLATEAWKELVAASVINVYILEDGINGWIETFGDPEFLAEHPRIDVEDDQIAFLFNAAIGDRYVAAQPNPDHFELEYESKVVLQVKRGASGGGCG